MVKNIKVSPVSPKLKVHFNILCSITNEKYLQVTPNIVWLSPDMIGGYFDIYSNVVWRIDIEPSVDDKDVVSMLFNQTMISNDTLFLNGDTPSQVLEMLHNGQMMTNETLLVDTNVIITKELESSTEC